MGYKSISDVIKILEEIKAQYGNLPCMVALGNPELPLNTVNTIYAAKITEMTTGEERDACIITDILNV